MSDRPNCPQCGAPDCARPATFPDGCGGWKVVGWKCPYCAARWIPIRGMPDLDPAVLSPPLDLSTARLEHLASSAGIRLAFEDMHR